MVSVRGIRWPVGVRIMRCNDLYFATGFRYAMQLIHETEHVRNMLDHVTTNDLFKFVIGERVWKCSEIVNDIGMTKPICIDADRSGKFVLTTTYVEDLFHSSHAAVCVVSRVARSCRLIA